MSAMTAIEMKHRSLDLPRPLLSEIEIEDFGGFVDIYIALLPYSVCEYITRDV